MEKDRKEIQPEVAPKPTQENNKLKMTEALKLLNPLRTRKGRALVSGLAVAVAFLATPQSIEGKKPEKKISLSDIIPTPTVEDIKAWIKQAKPIVENAYSQASSVAGDLAIDHQEMVVEIGDRISNLLPTATPVVETPVAKPQIESRSDERSPIKVVEEPTSQTFTIAPTPAAVGSEVAEIAFKDFSFEKKPTLARPFDHKVANDVFEKMGLKMEDLMQPDATKMQNFDALTNPSVEVLPIFPKEVMVWKDNVTKFVNLHNQAYPESAVSSNVVLALMTMESKGYKDAVSPTGAIGLMQLTSVVYNKIFGLSATAVEDPETNIAVGVSYLGEILKYNKNLGYANLNEQYVRVMEYNGGQVAAVNIVEGNRDAAPDETKNYGDNFLRFVVVAEIAQDLKDQGFTDEEVSKLLASSFYEKRIGEARQLKHNLRAKGGLNYETSKGILVKKASEENLAGIVTQILDVSQLEESEQNPKSNPALTTIEGYVYT